MNILFESDRFYFREFHLEDAEALFNLNADPDVVKYTGDLPFESIEKARKFILNYDHYKNVGFGRWAVIKKHDDSFIGWCGLKHNEENEVDLGFRFYKSEWNKGYATESAKACIVYAKEVLKMDHIIARAAIENKASIRVLEKLGFIFQGKRACHGIEDAYRYILKI